MFFSTLPNPFIVWEGEAPAEPLRRKLGRSLALPLVSNAFAIAKMFRGLASPSPFFSMEPKLRSCNFGENLVEMANCYSLRWSAFLASYVGVIERCWAAMPAQSD